MFLGVYWNQPVCPFVGIQNTCIIGYCTCMGIYCVEQVLLAELPELARATTPKERVQHNIFSYKCNNLFVIYFDIVLQKFP